MARLLTALLAAILSAAFFSNGARAQSCAANIPHITGTWEVLPYQMPINPIQATLLPNGKILIVSGSENDASNEEGPESYRAAVWDPTGTTESSIKVQNLTYDVFCSGVSALPDGRSLVIGGTTDYSFAGDNRASIFDWRSEEWVQTPSMVDRRWYATATTLGDGRIMGWAGQIRVGVQSTFVEIYDVRTAGNGWSAPTRVPFTPPYYPRAAVLPNGNVFYTGHGSSASNANSWFFNPTNAAWTISAATTGTRRYGSFFLFPLLPPDYKPRVMTLGGGDPGKSSTEIIDLSASNPQWTPGPNMSTGRIMMNATILPNGKVLASGGSTTYNTPNTPGKTADLYNPVTNSFTSAGTSAYSRLYHSNVLLLPNATVASIGSNPFRAALISPVSRSTRRLIYSMATIA